MRGTVEGQGAAGSAARPAPATGRRRPKGEDGPRALDLVGEAIWLLRSAPLSAAAAYCAGSVPFVLGLLFFWSDMSRGAFARQRCFLASLGLACLFLWMKCWQAVFAAVLRAAAAGAQGAPWTARRVFRLAVTQAALQPLGLVAIPAALLLAFPFYAVHAFYQNVTVLGDGLSSGVRAVGGRAMRQALLWPRQNHVILWLLSPWVLGSGLLLAFGAARVVVSLTPELQPLHGALWFFAAMALVFYLVLPVSPFGCVVAGNMAAALVLLPQLLQSLLGVRTTFALSGWHAIFHTTFLATVLALSYLCLDPLVKAAHVLRCFHGESRRTGEDLAAALRRAQLDAGRREAAS